jgi:hypothetical protein
MAVKRVLRIARVYTAYLCSAWAGSASVSEDRAAPSVLGVSRKLRRAALLATVAAIAAGCGGASYTKRDFVARADAICAAAVRNARAVEPGALAASYAALAAVVESEQRQLHSLRRPPGRARERALLGRYFAALDGVVSDFRRLASAAAAGDAQGVAEAEAALRSSPVSALAASYGLSSCGTPGSTSA